jgi:hypothetical protein
MDDERNPPQNRDLPAGQYDCLHAHHDALEFPDGEIVLLTYLMEGQEAVVLQLPATSAKAPQRAAYV